MSAYSLDLRKKIVESVHKGVPKSETARRFGVDRATVKRYSASNSMSAAPWRAQEGYRQRAPKLDEKATKLFAKDLQQRGRGSPTLPEGRVLVRSVRGESERSDGLPSGRTPPQKPK